MAGTSRAWAWTDLVDLEGVVVDVRGALERAIGAEVFLPYDVGGRAVLVLTGWARHFGTPAYLSGHPFLTAAAAAALVDAGATLVGIDSLNIDDVSGGERPVHSTLLAADIPICEHLTGLEQLPSDRIPLQRRSATYRGNGYLPGACLGTGRQPTPRPVASLS